MPTRPSALAAGVAVAIFAASAAASPPVREHTCPDGLFTAISTVTSGSA